MRQRSRSDAGRRPGAGCSLAPRARKRAGRSGPTRGRTRATAVAETPGAPAVPPGGRRRGPRAGIARWLGSVRARRPPHRPPVQGRFRCRGQQGSSDRVRRLRPAPARPVSMTSPSCRRPHRCDSSAARDRPCSALAAGAEDAALSHGRPGQIVPGAVSSLDPITARRVIERVNVGAAPSASASRAACCRPFRRMHRRGWIRWRAAAPRHDRAIASTWFGLRRQQGAPVDEEGPATLRPRGFAAMSGFRVGRVPPRHPPLEPPPCPASPAPP